MLVYNNIILTRLHFNFLNHSQETFLKCICCSVIFFIFYFFCFKLTLKVFPLFLWNLHANEWVCQYMHEFYAMFYCCERNTKEDKIFMYVYVCTCTLSPCLYLCLWCLYCCCCCCHYYFSYCFVFLLTYEQKKTFCID